MDKNDIRRARLRQIISDRFQGTVARLAAFLDMKPPQLHRWLSGKQGIHEDSAEAMCKKLGGADRLTGFAGGKAISSFINKEMMALITNPIKFTPGLRPPGNVF